MKKNWKHGRGHEYLINLHLSANLCREEKCQHNKGRWVVRDDSGPEPQFFCFDPGTQLQKDIWLSAATSTVDHDARIQALRWYCFECCTIQNP